MDKRKHNKEGYCGWCGKQKGFYIALGACGHLHEVCTLCKREWCTQFKEFEQLSKPLLKPQSGPTETVSGRAQSPRRPPSRGNGKVEKEKVYKQIIQEAEGYLGDIMGELAESQYSEKGGSVGMIEGRVKLKRAEIKDCMFEALSIIHSDRPRRGMVRFNLDELRIDRKRLVDYWYQTDYK